MRHGACSSSELRTPTNLTTLTPIRSSAPPWPCIANLVCGFLEAVYHAALPIEFEKRRIAFQPEVRLSIADKGVVLPVTYKVDFICPPGIEICGSKLNL